ncbi:MAG: dihydroneopterin aldolase [Epsilonproteobacteria bacterium]|nr:dihydroneopterin aldolase [Campylobacterota bacterium]
MKIYIEDLSFEAIIGILDFEREKEQKVIINLTLDYHYTQENFVNYADVAALIKSRIQEQKFLLLEDALLDLSKILKKKFSPIQQLSLKITKPSILPDCRVSVADSFHFES